MTQINDEFYEMIKNDLKVIFRYLIKMGASVEDSEDIIQNTLLKTLQNLESLEFRNMRAWLFKVSLNNFYNLYRKNKPVVSIEVESLDRFFAEIGVDLEFENTDLRIQVRDALEKLKESQKALLIMKYHLELSCRDIGKLLGTDENTVKTSLYRARSAFKRIWEVC